MNSFANCIYTVHSLPFFPAEKYNIFIRPIHSVVNTKTDDYPQWVMQVACVYIWITSKEESNDGRCIAYNTYAALFSLVLSQNPYLV